MRLREFESSHVGFRISPTTMLVKRLETDSTFSNFFPCIKEVTTSYYSFPLMHPGWFSHVITVLGEGEGGGGGGLGRLLVGKQIKIIPFEQK